MYAGLDFGSTLTKAVWRDDDGLRYLSTADVSRHEFFGKLVEAGVKTAYRTGIGFPSVPSGLGIDVLGPPPSEAIAEEIRLQALGAAQLLKDGFSPSLYPPFLLVSVGTGTSYTRVTRDGEAVREPIGSGLGGGTILNLGRLFGAASVNDIREEGWRGEVQDVFVKDLLPGSALGDLPVSHFGKAADGRRVPKRQRMRDLIATLTHMIGCEIAADAVRYAAAMGTGRIVFVGSAVTAFNLLEDRLKQYVRIAGMEPIVPGLAAYAGALGAYLHIARSPSI